MQWLVWLTRRILDIVYCSLGVLVFSVYIVYDTQLIIGNLGAALAPASCGTACRAAAELCNMLCNCCNRCMVDDSYGARNGLVPCLDLHRTPHINRSGRGVRCVHSLPYAPTASCSTEDRSTEHSHGKRSAALTLGGRAASVRSFVCVPCSAGDRSHKYQFALDDYVFAALNLYLDVRACRLASRLQPTQRVAT